MERGDSSQQKSEITARFWERLDYLLQIGYKEDSIKAFKDYCLDQEWDEDSIIEDLDDALDSNIMDH